MALNTFPLQANHVIAAMEELLEAMFSMQSLPPQSLNIRGLNLAPRSRVEAGSNTSTVDLRVVGGDGKGSLESETVKYGHESHGTLTRK
jgi:hypothetical protein